MSVVDTDVLPTRLVRLLEYALVGASGVPVDMAMVWLLIDQVGTHHLLAQPGAWLVAMSWNFALNWWVTFDQPDGSLWRQYLSYGTVQAGALGVRIVTVAILVDALGAPVVPASLAGILLPAVLGFLSIERLWETKQ